MKTSYRWLQQFTDLAVLDLEVKELARSLTMIGLAVEGIEQRTGDTIFDLDISTNRPDCLNHLGVAREIAAHFRLEVSEPDCSAPQSSPPELPTSVSIENGELCPRYAARILKGFRIEESPAWLKSRLESLGQRPVNNVVDITNYVMMELGHPLHAFDYEKLRENRIVVRMARRGERLVTLDGVQRELDPSVLVICDARYPVGLAGIMGGAETEIAQQTRILLLESAYFNPTSIRATAKKFGLRTEASYRFERGADPGMPVNALNRACRLMVEVAGGQCVSPVIDEYPGLQSPVVVELTASRIEKVLGVSFDAHFVENILRRLQFEVSGRDAGKWEVQVPSFRHDVELEDDLIEELARHYGYDRIQSAYPTAPGPGNFLPTYLHDRTSTQTLEGLGFYEAINYVFSTARKEVSFWGRSTPMVPIANPLTEEDTHLRLSLLPGLVDSICRNLNHGNKDVRLFEFGKVFLPGPSGDREDYQEVSRLGMAATGEFYGPFWSSRDDVGFYHLKGVIEVLLGKLGKEAEFKPISEVSCLHPSVAAQVFVNGEPLGVVGELHPRVKESRKLLQKVLVAELCLDSLYSHPLSEPRHTSLGKFPSVESDLSFVVDKKVEYGRMITAIKALNIPELRDIRLLDLYQGPELPKRRVSLTVRLTFADPVRTLTQVEVSGYSEQIFSLLRSDFAAEARSQSFGSGID